MKHSNSVVSDRQREQFREEGLCILERVIDPETVTMLREECSYFLGYLDAVMDEQGVTTIGITHRGSRYFIANRYRASRRMRSFLFGELMAEVTRRLLGGEVYLFNEQWVVKGPEQGMKFSWHQDSGYVRTRDPNAAHPPYLTCWCALDDVDESNGTAYVLPHSRGGTCNTIYPHRREEGSNDLIGYDGDDPGVPVVAPAGSIAAFSSYNLHRSGANTSPGVRRVYLPQYSSAPIRGSNGELWGMAVPFLRGGQVVYEPAQDTASRHGPRPRPRA